MSPDSYHSQRAWEMRYRAWRSNVAIRREEVINPQLSTRYKRVVDSVEVVRLPSGATHTVAAGRADDLLWAHYNDQIEPEPTSGPVSFEAWLQSAEVAIEPNLRGWRTTLQIDDSVETIGESCTNWSGTSVPDSALPILNSLGRDGWEVVAVNEDKGPPDSEEPLGETDSTAIRYLLKRAAPAPVNGRAFDARIENLRMS
jgi:hypothetical protein